MTFTERDLEYVGANYVTLEQAVHEAIERGVLPRPSYVLPDGTQIVPADYFGLVNVKPLFEERYLAAGGPPEELEQDWEGYMSGTYGVCLRDVTPETIVRKGVLVNSLVRLLDSLGSAMRTGVIWSCRRSANWTSSSASSRRTTTAIPSGSAERPRATC
jgi:hypothetical protein